MANENPTGRRGFLRAGLAAATGAAAASTALSWPRRARAAEALSPDDPTAKALQYIEDAAKVDRTKSPAFKPGSHCASCALYQKAQAANDHAPCAAFGNKLVPAKAWCAAWVQAPA